MLSSIISPWKTETCIIFIFCGSFLFNGCTNHPDKSSNPGGWTITRKAVSQAEFRSALSQNINAPFVTTITDSAQIERALVTIDKFYTDREKELAKQELCKSPGCLTTFKACYPDLDLLLFYIADNHFVKAAFVKASTSEMAQKEERFNGDFGVLSKNGYWVGLKREDSDNYLKLELCQLVDGRFRSFVSAAYTDIDINENETQPMFWADDNTIYVAVREVGKSMPADGILYYVIRFTNEIPK